MQHIIRDSPTIKYSAQITNRYNSLIIKKKLHVKLLKNLKSNICYDE